MSRIILGFFECEKKSKSAGKVTTWDYYFINSSARRFIGYAQAAAPHPGTIEIAG
jgi:hypothetical protein